MIRVHVFCEGQTEETFVREILQDHFNNLNIFLNPIILRSSKYGKGGVSTYGKIKSQIERKCKEESTAWVTTLIDYYKFPHSFEVSKKNQTSHANAQAIQAAFQNDIQLPNFIANLIIHEFEGLLFSNPEAFDSWFDRLEVDHLKKISKNSLSPEHINDSPETAPSKRILNICGNYDKVLHGSLIAMDIGLDSIRKQCRSFDNWIKKIENLA